MHIRLSEDVLDVLNLRPVSKREFYSVDFTNQVDKLRDDSQYLNNQLNNADRSKSVTDFLNAKSGLKKMKVRSPDTLILGHVNINSIRNKFDSLIYTIDKQTKTLKSFLFLRRNWMIHSLRHNLKQKVSSPRICIIETIKKMAFYYIFREDIPSHLLECKSQCNIENLSVEIKLRKRKWFLNCSYNPHRNSISRHLECLNRAIMNIAKPMLISFS